MSQSDSSALLAAIVIFAAVSVLEPVAGLAASTQTRAAVTDLTTATSARQPSSLACGIMNDSNLVPFVFAGCPDGVCPTGRPIQFSLVAKGYDFSCAQHTYLWNFGDGTAGSTSPTPLHTFFLGGPYHVTVTITNAATGQVFTTSPDSLVLSARYGSNGGPCPTMALNDFILDFEKGDQCLFTNTCPPNQSIGFTVQPVNYDFACSQHSLEWDFGDGTKEIGGRTIRHSFPPTASFVSDYRVTVKIKNPQTPLGLTKELYFQVGRGDPGACPPMTFEEIQAGIRSFSQCPVNTCPANSPIDLTLMGVLYNFNCAPHSFNWIFGDGTTSVGGNTIQHSFPPGSGVYDVKVTITNTQQSGSFTPPALPLNVRACEASSALPARLDFAALGVSYYLPLDARATTFSLAAGALPPGLTLTDTAIEGTPQVAGRYAFTLRAMQGASCIASADYEMTVGALSRRHAVRP